MKECTICKKKLTGLQKKFCSRKCNNQSTNKKHQNYIAQQKRGLDRKRKLIKKFGGECEVCGYKKNSAALCFHHKKDKSFGLDLRAFSNRTYKKCEAEAAKCQLLCHNCHLELHNPELTMDR